MRAFETVRTVYLAFYAFIWVIAVGVILGTVIGMLTDKFAETPLLTVIGVAAAIAISALVLTWLLLITVCTIDSRNFLADIYELQLEKVETTDISSNIQNDRYDRRL